MAFLRAMAIGAVVSIEATTRTWNQLRKLGTAFDRVGRKIKATGQTLRRAGAAMRQLTIPSAIAGVGLGIMAHKAASFEQQMANVSAILGKTGRQDMPRLTAEAKKLGASTVFSATQVGEGMEFMSRAGFSAEEVMSGIGGVLNAAAAEGMGLAEASDIVASTIRGMGIEASQASHVADILAYTSAKTNTNIAGMGEGLKFATAMARQAGISVEEVVAGMGKLADAGMKGSLAGTGLAIALQKMAAPTDSARKLMKQAGIEFVKNAEGGIDLVQSMRTVGVAMRRIEDPAKRIALLTEVFGARGQKAAANLGMAALEAGERGFGPLVKQLRNANGAAAEMAETRLDTFRGQLKLLWSALEGVSIEAMTPLLKVTKTGVQWLAKFTSAVVEGLQGQGVGAAQDFGRGIRRAVDWIAKGVKIAGDLFKRVGAALTKALGPKRARDLGIVSVALTAILAVVGPLVTAGAAVGVVFSLIGSVLIPLAKAALVLGGALAVIFGAGFAVSRRQGDSFVGTLRRMVVWIKTVGMGFYLAFERSWGPIKESFFQAVDGFKLAWQGLVEAFTAGSGGMTVSAAELGVFLGNVVAMAVRGATYMWRMIAVALRLGAVFTRSVVAPILGAFRTLASGWIDLLSGATSFRDAVVKIFKGVALLITTPFRTTMLSILGMVETMAGTALGKAALKAVGLDPKTVMEGFKAASRGLTSFEFNREERRHSKLAADALEGEKRQQAAATSVDVEVKVPKERRLELNVDVPLEIDGVEVGRATKRAEMELSERAGFSSTPWQRFRVHEGGF
jgi:TP901 family phage tail tape measure protein